MAKHNDRRVRKTETQLIKGLTELMKTKSIKDITVRELSDQVDINRSTFYLHYKDIYDMVEKIENSLTANFLDTLDELSKNRITQSGLKDFLQDTYNIIYSNVDICSVLLSPNGDIAFHKKMTDIIFQKTHDIIKNLMPSNSTENEIKIATCYFISGIIGIIEAWLQDISMGTPEYMAEISCNLIEKGIHTFNINSTK
ncbi:MAG: TetR/AcrR family transcriptional regulator [Oscillospiraceae bacterium]